MNRNRTLIGLVVGLILAAQATTTAAPKRHVTCAVLIDAALDRPALIADLLEERLSRMEGLQLVERREIDKVLAEIELQMLSRAEGMTERLKAGAILKADVLVILKAGRPLHPKLDGPANGAPAQYLELIVSETVGGLRLAARPVVCSNKAEEDVNALADIVRNALVRMDKPITEIVAVPPFVSADLTRTRDYLQRAYAELLEQLLLLHTQALVVELPEAEAISRELLLAGNGEGPRRPLPLYILGEYRHADGGVGKPDAPLATVRVTLRRGGQVLATMEKRDVAASRVPAFLRESVEKFVPKSVVKLPNTNPIAEIRQLTERSDTFFRIGNYSEALDLCEAGLLLDGRQENLHARAVASSCEAAFACGESATSKDFPAAGNVALQYLQHGLQHLEWLLRSGASREYYSPHGLANRFMRVLERMHTYSRPASRGQAEIHSMYEQCTEQARELLFLCLRERLRSGSVSVGNYGHVAPFCIDFYLGHNSEEQKRPRRLEILRLLAAHPGGENFFRCAMPIPPWPYSAPPEHAAFNAWLEEASRIPSDALAHELANLSSKYEEMQVGKEVVSAPVLPLDTSRPPDVVFSKLKFTTIGANGQLREVDLHDAAGWMPCGKRTDVIWRATEIFLMNEPGRIKRMASVKQGPGPIRSLSEKFYFDNGVYDGRYIWVPAVSPQPLLVIIDPETEETWQFTAADGVPPSSKAVVALADVPGAIYLAGAFERTWVARVQFDGRRKPTFKILFEAREQLDGTADPQKQVTNPKLRFDPSYLIRCTRPGPPARSFLVVGRDNLGTTGHYPGMLDLESGAFNVGNDRLTSNWIDLGRCALRDGTVYWVESHLPEFPRSRQHVLTVYRLRLPEMTREVVAADIRPPGEWIRSTIFFYDGRVHLVGDTWCRSDQWGKPLESLQLRRMGYPELPDHPNKIPGTELYARGGCPPIRFCVSSHYGLVNFGSRAGVFQVQFNNGKSSAPLQHGSREQVQADGSGQRKASNILIEETLR